MIFFLYEVRFSFKKTLSACTRVDDEQRGKMLETLTFFSLAIALYRFVLTLWLMNFTIIGLLPFLLALRLPSRCKRSLVHGVFQVSFSSCTVLICPEDRTIRRFLLPALEFSFLLPPAHVLPRCTASLYALAGCFQRSYVIFSLLDCVFEIGHFTSD